MSSFIDVLKCKLFRLRYYSIDNLKIWSK